MSPEDLTGEAARAQALTTLFGACAQGVADAGPCEAFVLERRRNQQQANLDAQYKAAAARTGALSPRAGLFQCSPADENLLWLPDVVCGAYRQQVVRNDPRLFNIIRDISTVIQPSQ